MRYGGSEDLEPPGEAIDFVERPLLGVRTQLNAPNYVYQHVGSSPNTARYSHSSTTL